MIEAQIILAALIGGGTVGALIGIVFEIADRRFHNRLIARIEEGNREIHNWLRESRQPTQEEIDAAGKAESREQ